MREAVATDFALEVEAALVPQSDAYGLDVCHPATRAAFAARAAEHDERFELERQRALQAQRERERRLAAEAAGDRA